MKIIQTQQVALPEPEPESYESAKSSIVIKVLGRHRPEIQINLKVHVQGGDFLFIYLFLL